MVIKLNILDSPWSISLSKNVFPAVPSDFQTSVPVVSEKPEKINV
jgi:hypothetical protein